MGYTDSYSGRVLFEKVEVEQHAGLIHFLIDKLSLKFNLAACLSRMSSRIDLTWDPTSNKQKGVIQACQLYQKAAGIYEDIASQLIQIEHLGNKRFWLTLKQHLGEDLQIKTCQMMKHVMVAQAQYLIFNNMQKKVSHQAIDTENEEIRLHFGCLVLQISNSFLAAYQSVEGSQEMQMVH